MKRNPDRDIIMFHNDIDYVEGTNIDNNKNYPACFDCDNIITVGSATRTGKTEIKSNFGPNNVDILAPGKNIYCLYNFKVLSALGGGILLSIFLIMSFLIIVPI